MNFANAAQTTLSSPCTAGATAISVVSVVPFPSAPFRLNIGAEILICTAIIGLSLTVTRATEGTTAAAYPAGQLVTHIITAADATGWSSVVPTPYDMLSQLVNTPTVFTGDTTAVGYDQWYVANISAAHTLSLPTPTAGKLIGVRSRRQSTAFVTLSAPLGATLDGTTSRILAPGEAAVLLGDGTDWLAVSGRRVAQQAQISDGNVTQVGMTGRSYVPITLATIVVNATISMAAVANTITVKRAGNYRVDGSCDLVVSATVRTILTVKYNGVDENPRLTDGPSDPGGFFKQSATFIKIAAAVADTFQLSTYVDQAANYQTEPGQQFLTLTEEPTWP